MSNLTRLTGYNVAPDGAKALFGLRHYITGPILPRS